MKQELLNFMLEVDSDFTTPMSERVDLMEYCDKLINHACISTILDGGSIAGAVAIYCNNPNSRLAYIPFVAVKADKRGKGLSRALMLGAIALAKAHGFERIGLHTDNYVALKLYHSLGFEVVENTERKYLELNLK